MLRSRISLGALVASSVLALALINCGGDGEESGAPPPDSTSGALPPAPDPSAPDGDGPGAVIAIKKLYLGDADRSGTQSKTAWRKFGFDLDGKATTPDSTGLCKPRQGGKPSVIYADGDNGIDNSFGKNILPVLLGVSPDASKRINESITKGNFSMLFAIDKLGPGPTYQNLLTRLYGGARRPDDAGPPKFDGTDEWPVVRELLTDPTNIESAQVQFAKSYVVDNTWVSGTKATLNLGLAIGGVTLNLTIESALVSMDLSADRKIATNGTIAGVIDTDLFISELAKVAGNLSPSLCEGTMIQTVTKQLAEASDIMKDGSSGSPDKECDGISIGLGFEGALVKLGGIAEPASPPKDPCADGG